MKKLLISVGLLASTGAFASTPFLSAFTCKGNFGPEDHSWNIRITVVSGSPITQGRGFAEVLKSPNFPSGIRIAPEGYYVMEHFSSIGTTYNDDQNQFWLRIPKAQPPMGATVGGFLATLRMNGQNVGTIPCDRAGERSEE
jgi:hypothetical protein